MTARGWCALGLFCCALPAAAQQDAGELRRWLDGRIEQNVRPLRGSLEREAARRTADLTALRRLPDERRARALALLEVVRRTPPALLAGSVLDTRTLSFTTLPAVAPELARARMVHVAESHDQAGHHQVQAQVIELLARYPGKTAVGFEMFPHTLQAVLDRYAARRTTEQQFLAEIDWKKTWGFPWPLYAPVLRAAQRHRMPLVGLNIPRDLVRQVSRLGLDGLPRELRDRLPRTIDTANAAHRKRFFGMMGGHPGADMQRMERYYQSMCVWDEAMAAHAARYLAARPELKRMVLIAGSGHLAFGPGIPDRAARRGARPYVIVVPRTADAGAADTARSDILRPPGRFVVFTR